MKRFNFLLSLLFLVLFSTVLKAQKDAAPFVPGKIMVMMKPDKMALSVTRTFQQFDMKVVKEVSEPMRIWLFEFDPQSVDHFVLLEAIRSHPAVQLAQSDHYIQDRATVPNDPNFSNQWHHVNPNDADIDSDLAWDITTGGLTEFGDTIVVCIIENADLPHPDIQGNAWYNFNEIPNNGMDDDQNGYVDDFEGWNPGGNNDNVYGGGHGTQVAGMIGAKGDNSLGVVGANWDVKMMVVTRDGISESVVIESYTYPLVMRRLYNQTAGANGAFVVATNASWGIDGGQPSNAPLWCAMYDTLGTAGILNCGATANNAVDIDVVGDLPTACPSDFMVSVTATNDQDMRTFSAWGLTTIDVGAPGSNIHTTSIGGGYGNTSGTSFASPLTAGVIGLLYSVPCASLMTLVHADPEAGALAIRQALFDGVDVVGNLPGNTVTGGRINSYNSLMELINNCSSNDCIVPINLGVSQTLGTTEYNLMWSSNPDALSYNVRVRPTSSTTWIDYPGILTNEFMPPTFTWCTEYEFQVEAVCDTSSSGFSASHIWMTDGCCIVSGLTQIDDVLETTAQANWESVLAGGSYDLRYRELGAINWIDVNSVIDTFYVFTGLDSCSTYEYQVRTSCINSTTPYTAIVEFSTSGCGACVDNTYCASMADDATEEWIGNVTVGTINNDTDSDGGYGDYTNVSTDLAIGTMHPISLTPEYDSFVYDEYFKVWIDLDHNGDFLGTGELVYDAGGLADQTITGNLTIPTSATFGVTRIRVIMERNGPAADGCEDGYSYGETEDYCVNITEISTSISAYSNNDINFYPNPANDRIIMDLHGNSSLTGSEWTIMDRLGKVVLTGTLLQDRTQIDISDLANGVYFYEITIEGDRFHQDKLIITR